MPPKKDDKSTPADSLNGFEPKEGVVCGGPTKSDLWMQMHSDVSNLPISFTRVPEAPTLGSAILGAVGAGAYPDIHEAARNMVETMMHPTIGATRDVDISA